MHYPFSTSEVEYEDDTNQVLQWNYGFLDFITCFGSDETTGFNVTFNLLRLKVGQVGNN